jgi:hypothetical protein
VRGIKFYLPPHIGKVGERIKMNALAIKHEIYETGTLVLSKEYFIEKFEEFYDQSVLLYCLINHKNCPLEIKEQSYYRALNLIQKELDAQQQQACLDIISLYVEELKCRQIDPDLIRKQEQSAQKLAKSAKDECSKSYYRGIVTMCKTIANRIERKIEQFYKEN